MPPELQFPSVIAGPIVRRCTSRELTLWFAATEMSQPTLKLGLDSTSLSPVDIDIDSIQIGDHCFLYLIHWRPADDISNIDKLTVFYDIGLVLNDQGLLMSELMPDALYGDETCFSVAIDMDISELVHGSCRKPHHASRDGLLTLDNLLSSAIRERADRPSYLMLSGDQIYGDDVAGPMLSAVHQTIALLGLFDEKIEGAEVSDSQSLYTHVHSYYGRTRLLPEIEPNEAISESFIGGKKKPIFTSVSAENHLITCAEYNAMYLLVWSPVLWPAIDLSKSFDNTKLQEKYDAEAPIITEFSENLGRVRRALAHIPTYMIFDDHDVTDDWNLTREWEESSYSHPFSRRIISNALLSYFLFQGWGNRPESFEVLKSDVRKAFNDRAIHHEDFVYKLMHWHDWHYDIPTNPPTFVLDTRTQRWRSERKASKPSGLMDWESLSDLQQKLIGVDSAILVSAAPVYGVKLIEVVQKVFAFFGRALMVDAENWMAHRGAASVMLNLFSHKKTPELFIILSGDVHYSFVYDVKLRFKSSSPRIIQITASGIKNEFPDTLLRVFDWLNRWLYHRYSPLNTLTKRRNMSIKPRKPSGREGRALLNQSGMGVLKLSIPRPGKNGDSLRDVAKVHVSTKVVSTDGLKNKTTEFISD